MESPPPAPRSIDPGVPEPLDRIVTQCIQPDAAKRFQTTPQLVAALNRLDTRGRLLPVVRRITRRLVGAVGGRRRGDARPHLVAGAGARGPGRARAGLGADCRLQERHRRPDIRSHARADPEAGAGRRRVHQRLRSQRHSPQPRRSPARDTGRTGGAAAGRQAGRQRRAVRRGRAPGQPLHRVGQGGPGGHGQRHRHGVGAGVAEGSGAGGGDLARVRRSRSARRRHVRFGAAIRHGDADGDLASTRSASTRAGWRRCPAASSTTRSRASRRRWPWTRTSASPTARWRRRRATSSASRMRRSTRRKPSVTSTA